jgi:hypothetical protein
MSSNEENPTLSTTFIDEEHNFEINHTAPTAGSTAVTNIGIVLQSDADAASMPSLQSRYQLDSESEDTGDDALSANSNDSSQSGQHSRNTDIGVFQQSEAEEDTPPAPSRYQLQFDSDDSSLAEAGSINSDAPPSMPALTLRWDANFPEDSDSDDSSRPSFTYQRPRPRQPCLFDHAALPPLIRHRHNDNESSDSDDATRPMLVPRRLHPLPPHGSHQQGQSTPNSDDWIDNNDEYTQAPSATDRPQHLEVTRVQDFDIQTISFPSDGPSRQTNRSQQPEVDSANKQVLDAWRAILTRPVHPPGPVLVVELDEEAPTAETAEIPTKEPRTHRFRQSTSSSLLPPTKTYHLGTRAERRLQALTGLYGATPMTLVTITLSCWTSERSTAVCMMQEPI